MTNRKKQNSTFAFFGTSQIAVYVLEALEEATMWPALVVTRQPRAQGRGLELHPSEVEEWAHSRGIAIAHNWDAFEKGAWDVAVVCDYGKLLPRALLDIPRRGFLNVHPSLLPRLRGASPIRSAILRDEKASGVTVMLLSEGMDEGPIVAQRKVEVTDWPPTNSALEGLLMHAGGQLLAHVLPEWIAGTIEAREQNHDLATYCEKIKKGDGLLDLFADGYQNLLKIRAYEGWPGTYAFFERGGKRIRVQILDAHLEHGTLVIDTVKPEGKREMKYEDFLRSGAKVVQ